MRLQDVAASFGTKVTIQAGEHLFRQGDAENHFYIVQDGLLKAYYVSDEGKESIKSFLLPGEVIGSLTALTGKGGCSFNLTCLKDSTLTKVPFDAVRDAAWNDTHIGAAVIDFLMAFGMKKEQREYELLCLSAEDRFRKLQLDRPELLDLVQQNDIALYLGVTPVGLSRIKKRVNAPPQPLSNDP